MRWSSSRERREQSRAHGSHSATFAFTRLVAKAVFLSIGHVEAPHLGTNSRIIFVICPWIASGIFDWNGKNTEFGIWSGSVIQAHSDGGVRGRGMAAAAFSLSVLRVGEAGGQSRALLCAGSFFYHR